MSLAASKKTIKKFATDFVVTIFIISSSVFMLVVAVLTLSLEIVPTKKHRKELNAALEKFTKKMRGLKK